VETGYVFWENMSTVLINNGSVFKSKIIGSFFQDKTLASFPSFRPP
jgi:hypothetical protein